MKHTAFILTGQLRLNSPALKRNWYFLKKLLKGKDVFVCTYEKYLNEALEITTHDYIFLIDEYLTPQTIKLHKIRKSYFQLFQLENVLIKFENILSEYECIIRIRNDLSFSEFDLNDYANKAKILSCQNFFTTARSDFVYSGPANSFIRLAKEQKCISQINDREKFVTTPLNYANYLTTLKSHKNFFFGKHTTMLNVPLRWVCFNHDFKTMCDINKQHSFSVYECDFTNGVGGQFNIFHPINMKLDKFQEYYLSQKSLVNGKDTTRIRFFLENKDAKKVWNFLYDLSLYCLEYKPNEKMTNTGSLITNVDARPEHGLLKWFLNVGALSPVKTVGKLLLLR